MSRQQLDFASIRIGEVFRQDNKKYKKVCDRTAAPFEERADGSHEFRLAVCFFAEEKVDLYEDSASLEEDSGLSSEEFDFLVRVAQIPSEGRAGAVRAWNPPFDRQQLSGGARELLDMLMGDRSGGMAAKAWLAVILRAAK